eukprot:2561016-Lingulodinium_polyedra.AAC.1
MLRRYYALPALQNLVAQKNTLAVTRAGADTCQMTNFADRANGPADARLRKTRQRLALHMGGGRPGTRQHGMAIARFGARTHY